MRKITLSFLSMLAALLIFTGCGNGEPADTLPEGSYINGIELSNFVIVYKDDGNGYNQHAAEYIQSEIKNRTEIELEVVKDARFEAEYEIVVGETSRGISTRLDAQTEGMQFSILAEEKQVALEGDHFIIAAAAYYFIDTYVPTDNFKAEIPKEATVCDPIVKEAKNFILLIGDGMGPNQTKLFETMKNDREFGDGEDMFYGYYFPYKGFSKTNNYNNEVTDSAAGGTALSSGYKTINGFVGQDRSRNKVRSLTEIAGILGKSTCVMSTEPSTGATPASFSAHANNRDDTSDIISSQTKLKQIYGTIITCDFNKYTKAGILDIEKRITKNLAELEKNENGFFLMYEEAHIDKHCHNKDIKNTFSTVVRFNQAIATFMEHAFYNPDTFVLITADHETGGLTYKNGKYSYTVSSHTGVDVPIFAYGDGAELFGGVTIENIQIPQTIADFMGVLEFGDPARYNPLTK